MTRYVIGPDVALRLAEQRRALVADCRLLAPTLLRSQVLSWLYADVQRGTISRKDADRRLGYLRGLKIRLLGDRSLQQSAWKIAERLHWTDTFVAEYIALAQLQADAFITLDRDLARTVEGEVQVATIDALFSATVPQPNATSTPP
jgi:predicted nucleic acid-binding protein